MAKRSSVKPRVQAEKNYIEVKGKIFTVLEYFVDARVTRKPVAFLTLPKLFPSPAPPSIASSILWKSWRS